MDEEKKKNIGNLTEEQKKKKQEEIAQRLAEIKKKLSNTAKIPEAKTKKKVVPAEKKKVTISQPAVQKTKVTSKSPTTNTNDTFDKNTSINDKWSANKLKPSPAKKKSFPPPRPKKSEESKPSNKGKIKKITLAIAIVLFAIFLIWFILPVVFSYFGSESSVKNATTEMKKESKDEESNSENENVSEKIIESEIAQKPDKWGLDRPCYIISYGATKNENYAAFHTDQLTIKGYSAGYYWIPDYLTSGNEFFKIYIGPFDTKADALGLLEPIKKQKQDAYVHLVD